MTGRTKITLVSLRITGLNYQTHFIHHTRKCGIAIQREFVFHLSEKKTCERKYEREGERERFLCILLKKYYKNGSLLSRQVYKYICITYPASKVFAVDCALCIMNTVSRVYLP